MKLIYFYDALCGWCYGFSSTIQKFVANHAKEFDVEVISGGMVVGERVGPIGNVAPYISSAFKTVEEKTGVKFGDKFLNEVLKPGTAIFSSLPPAIALSAFKQLCPDQQLAYAAGLQKLIYYDGVATDATEEFIELGVSLGADQDELATKMAHPDSDSAALKEFAYAQKLGVSGFPMTVLSKDKELYALGRGSVDGATLEANYQSLLQDA